MQKAAYSLPNARVKHILTLGIALASIWVFWSGHFEAFMVFLGLISVVLSVWIASRMQITDEEGAPLNMGLRPIGYAIWLAKEIVQANVHVSKLILDPKLPIQPRMICVQANQKTELGRVVFANSITLTPGTVSVDLQSDHIWVHALSFAGAEEDLSGDMDRRVCDLEGE